MSLALILALSAIGVGAAMSAAAWATRHRRRADDSPPMTLRPVVGRTPGPAFRADAATQLDAIARAPRVDATTRTLDELAAALRAAGLEVEARSRELVIADVAPAETPAEAPAGQPASAPAARLVAPTPAAVTVVALELHARSYPTAIAVAAALVPVYGPLELRGPLMNLLVDGTQTRAELIAEHDVQFRAAVDQLRAQLEASQAMFQELSDKLGKR